MSSTSNIQNVLSNVVRPVYVYDPATSNYSAKVIISNVDTFSVKTIEVENLEFGDANSNVYLGIDAGSENSNSRRNVGVGVGAAQNNVNTKNSVFVGYAAGGENITDASASVVLGASTLSGGSSNVYVGFGTGSSASNASGNIFLGPNLTMAIPLSNEIRIGNGSNIPFSANMNNRYIGLNTATPNYELDVSADTANFQGDVRITGSLRVAGSGGLESAQPSAVELGNGDTATGSGNLSTISFQSNTGGYRHMIRSRHDASSSPTTTNAVDIFVNTSATATGSSQPGTGNVLGLSVTAAGVGVGVSNPAYALDVSGTVRAGAIVTSGGATTLGDVVLSNGTVKLYDGSSNAPTLTFQNDTSLGLYRSGANMLTVASAGSNRMTFSNANVGIGTLNPAYSLDVCGIVRATGFIGTSGSGSSGGVVFSNGGVALSNGTVSDPALTFQSDLSLGMYRIGANQVGFVSAGSNRMTISNGNVGIGTTTPQILLDLSSATADQGITITAVNAQVNLSNPGVAPLQLYNNGSTQGLFTNNVLPLSLWTNGGRRLNILSNGNVGIGFTDASHALDVNGTTRTSNALVSGYLRNALTPTQFDMSGGTLFLSNRIITGAGTVSAPAHTFLNDASMGLYDPATNTLGLVTSGVERMRVASNGFVGIGTQLPATALDVCATNQVLTLTSTATTSPTPIATVYQPNLTTTSPSNYTYQLFGVNASSSNAVAGLFTYNGSGSASNSYRMYIQGSTGGITMRADGNVGIGTTAPIYTLDVSCGNTQNAMIVTATAYPRITLTTSHTDPSGGTILYDGTVSGNRFMLRTSGGTPITFESPPNSERMRLTSGGNLGIGTTAPLGRLHIASGGIVVNQIGNLTANTDVSMIVEGSSNVGMYLQKGNDNNSGGLSFKTAVGGVLGERMRIDGNTGFVGIGTTGPTYALDVCESVNVATRFITAQFRNTNASGQAAINVTGGGVADTSGLRFFHNPGSNIQGIYSSNLLPFHIYTNNIQRLTILSNGNVGIANTSPSDLLHMSGGNFKMSTSGNTYPRLLIAAGNASGYMYPAYNLYGEGINIGFNYYVIDTSGGATTRVVENAGLAGGTSRTRWANGFIANYTGPQNTEPTNLGYFQDNRGYVGIATTAPRSGFQLSSNITGFYDAAYDSSESMHLVTHRAFRVETAAPRENHFANLYLVTDVSFTNSSVTNSAGAICFASQNSEFNGYNVAYARVSGVKVGSFYGGLSFATMHNSNDGLLRENVRIQNGQMGIGTSAPAYTLDISTAPTAASINMTTWPRMNTTSNFFWVRGHCNATVATYRVRWNTTNLNSPNTSILDWQDNATHGSYFRILKSGIWSITYTVNCSAAGYTWIDASTNFTNGYATPNTSGTGDMIVFGSSSFASYNAAFTGYLPASTTRYYRFSSTNSTNGSVTRTDPYLTIALLYETPDISPAFFSA